MAISLIVILALCLLSAIVLGAGGIILAVYLSSQRDKPRNDHE